MSDGNHLHRIPWMEMCLLLPEAGVRSHFPDAEACRRRLADVRWPGKVTCVRCSGTDVGYLELRKLCHCRNCRHQFSVTSGTIANRSRVNLRTWFIAAEDIINAYARNQEAAWLTGHYLKNRYGISYAAAFRLKKLLVRDLQEGGGGLFGRCICVSQHASAPDVVVDRNEYFWILFEAISERKQWFRAC